MNLHFPQHYPVSRTLQPSNNSPGPIQKQEHRHHQHSPQKKKNKKKQTKSASNDVRQAVNGFYFCTDLLESPDLDHQLKKSLKPLSSLKKMKIKI